MLFVARLSGCQAEAVSAIECRRVNVARDPETFSGFELR